MLTLMIAKHKNPVNESRNEQFFLGLFSSFFLWEILHLKQVAQIQAD